MRVRALAKQLLPPALVTLMKRGADQHPRYFGLDELDRKLEKYLNISNGFFVELGANDGVTQSNTLYFERYRNWRGVLVEPAPHNYLKCRTNRSPDTKIYCNACTSFEYKNKFVEIAYSNLMSTPIGLESDILHPHAHAEKGRTYLPAGEDIFVFGALAKPLNEILIEAEAPPLIDLLSLDVEGAELEVLKGIDHGRFRFRFMCIESRRERLAPYLTPLGYRFLEQLSVQDFLFGIDPR